MRHIVVPTDFSETARAALRYAVNLCRDLRGRMTVLHVIFAEKYQNEFPGLDAFGYLSASVDLPGGAEGTIEQWKALALDRLNASIDPKWREGISIETLVIDGRPSKAIVDYACADQGDMIVMGTHGRGPVAQFFLGSVTENVLRSSKCPVVVVRGS